MTGRSTDVLVIGGGISGMSACKLLHESGVDFVCLEARDRVGGRTYTKRDPLYKYVDIGGAYVGPAQDRILRMAKDLGIQTYKVYAKGDYIHYSKGKITRFQATFPRFSNPFAWFDVVNCFREIDKLSQEISIEAPWKAPHAAEWDNQTLQQFIDKVCWTNDCKEFIRSFCNAAVCTEPSEISLLWFFWYMRECDGTRRLWEVGDGAQERKFVGGSGQISEKIADIIGDKLIMEAPVIKLSDRSGIVTAETMDGRIFQAKHAIIAIAPSLQLKIHFDPPMPGPRYGLIQRVPMGACIKNNVFYKKAFWRGKGLTGFSSSGDGEAILGNTVDDTKPDGSCPALTGFILADQARKLANKTKEERKRLTCEHYAKLFGTDEALYPVHYEEGNWPAEEYSGGCYTSTYPPGVMTGYGAEIRKPLGNIYFAGTETATYWSGYMDGAVEAGERAVREILFEMGKLGRDEIWQVEPMSKDVPSAPLTAPLSERMAPSVGGALKLLAFATAVAGAGAIKFGAKL